MTLTMVSGKLRETSIIPQELRKCVSQIVGLSVTSRMFLVQSKDGLLLKALAQTIAAPIWYLSPPIGKSRAVFCKVIRRHALRVHTSLRDFSFKSGFCKALMKSKSTWTNQNYCLSDKRKRKHWVCLFVSIELKHANTLSHHSFLLPRNHKVP